MRFRVLSDYLKYTIHEELVLLHSLPLMLVVCETLHCSLSVWKLATGFTSTTLTFHVSFLIFSCLWQPDRGPAVPKFGDWDETDPAAAEGYTQVFNLVREEKNNETGKVPVKPTETSYSSTQKEANENGKVNM